MPQTLPADTPQDHHAPLGDAAPVRKRDKFTTGLLVLWIIATFIQIFAASVLELVFLIPVLVGLFGIEDWKRWALVLFLSAVCLQGVMALGACLLGIVTTGTIAPELLGTVAQAGLRILFGFVFFYPLRKQM